MSLPHKISALVYAFNPKGELLMIHRRSAPNAGFWSPFGGKLHEWDGESPHQCAVRETAEETGLKFGMDDFHLTGMVSEKAYENETHWLMFMFELKVAVKKLPPPHKEGVFEFVPLNQVLKKNIPSSDRKVLWPLFLKNRGGFFALSIICKPDGAFTWKVEEEF